MSNIDNITQKILADARAQAEEIASQTQQAVDELLSESHVRAQTQSERIIEKATEEASHRKAMIISNARIKARDEALEAKQVILGRVFDMARRMLSQLSDQEFGDFLQRTLKGIELTGDEKLVVPGERLAFVKQMGLSVPIDEEQTVADGFQLRGSQMVLNYSFPDLVEMIKPEMEGEIIQRLFPEEA